MKLSNIGIGPEHPPFVIAEISANHKQDLQRTFEMIKAAHKTGVQCIKLQTWSPNSMSLNLKQSPFLVTDPNSLWQGYTLHDLYEEAYLPWEWHQPIFDLCQELQLPVISTPFDLKAVDFLETLNVPFYKIASFENIDLPLIAHVAKTGKPMIISCGLANIKEIYEAVHCARDNGAKRYYFTEMYQSISCRS